MSNGWIIIRRPIAIKFKTGFAQFTFDVMHKTAIMHRSALTNNILTRLLGQGHKDATSTALLDLRRHHDVNDIIWHACQPLSGIIAWSRPERAVSSCAQQQCRRCHPTGTVEARATHGLAGTVLSGGCRERGQEYGASVSASTAPSCQRQLYDYVGPNCHPDRCWQWEYRDCRVAAEAARHSHWRCSTTGTEQCISN